MAATGDLALSSGVTSISAPYFINNFTSFREPFWEANRIGCLFFEDLDF